MDRDLDALDRALQAVKTRSANALVNEQSYISRIAQLEEVNRQLQAQLTVQTGLPTNAPANASEGSADPDGMKRSSSYMSMRTKSNHLVVAQLASDDGHGSDDSAGGKKQGHQTRAMFLRMHYDDERQAGRTGMENSPNTISLAESTTWACVVQQMLQQGDSTAAQTCC